MSGYKIHKLSNFTGSKKSSDKETHHHCDSDSEKSSCKYFSDSNCSPCDISPINRSEKSISSISGCDSHPCQPPSCNISECSQEFPSCQESECESVCKSDSDSDSECGSGSDSESESSCKPCAPKCEPCDVECKPCEKSIKKPSKPCKLNFSPIVCKKEFKFKKFKKLKPLCLDDSVPVIKCKKPGKIKPIEECNVKFPSIPDCKLKFTECTPKFRKIEKARGCKGSPCKASKCSEFGGDKIRDDAHQIEHLQFPKIKC
jgi:hypothetical protein